MDDIIRYQIIPFLTNYELWRLRDIDIFNDAYERIKNVYMDSKTIIYDIIYHDNLGMLIYYKEYHKRVNEDAFTEIYMSNCHNPYLLKCGKTTVLQYLIDISNISDSTMISLTVYYPSIKLSRDYGGYNIDRLLELYFDELPEDFGPHFSSIVLSSPNLKEPVGDKFLRYVMGYDHYYG